MSFWNKYKILILTLILTYLISIPAGIITGKSVGTWYANIARPSFSPPNWIFGPVWTTLYALMSVAVWNAWRIVKSHNHSLAKNILIIYYVHLLIGASWSFVFFGFHQIGFAASIIVLIIIFILWLMRIYFPISKLSFYLMIPYLLWSSFALVLNITIWKLN